MLLETMYLSIDPAMRSWMSGPVALGEVIRCGGMARVLQSVAPGTAWLADASDPAGDVFAGGGREAWRRAGVDRSARIECGDGVFCMRDIGTVKPGDRCGTQSRLDVPITSTVLATPMPVTPGSSWIEAAVARHQLLDIIVQSARTGQT